jgi:putative CocE/NonD family hydrolase
MGPWVHGVGSTRAPKSGDRVFGPASAIDYDEVVLRFMDRYVKGLENGLEREPRVRAFVMGENAWHAGAQWPPLAVENRTLYLSSANGAGRLTGEAPAAGGGSTSFVSDPAHPVTNPFSNGVGAHDYRELASRKDVAVFETEPLPADLTVLGAMEAHIQLSSDAPDVDLWVKVHDVAPDGTSWNLMSPGLDVMRASLRDGKHAAAPLKAGEVVTLRFTNLYTGNRFAKGHRLRIVLSPQFYPDFSRNLQTGERETVSAATRKATLTIHHDAKHPSRLVLPVVP